MSLQSSVIPCARLASIRVASASLVPSVPCALCMSAMKLFARGDHGASSPPAASRMSPMFSQASLVMPVLRERCKDYSSCRRDPRTSLKHSAILSSVWFRLVMI